MVGNIITKAISDAENNTFKFASGGKIKEPVKLLARSVLCLIETYRTDMHHIEIKIKRKITKVSENMGEKRRANFKGRGSIEMWTTFGKGLIWSTFGKWEEFEQRRASLICRGGPNLEKQTRCGPPH